MSETPVSNTNPPGCICEHIHPSCGYCPYRPPVPETTTHLEVQFLSNRKGWMELLTVRPDTEPEGKEWRDEWRRSDPSLKVRLAKVTTTTEELP